MDKKTLKNHPAKKRSFLSLTTPTPESWKNIVPQTFGKTQLDFVTFLAVC
ncbi:hypothetical protein [Leisingera sp. M658]|nr:hypothetical protein [Leisingera sp. M658]UWQ75458.1 hypothetical protein K3724_03035 [Leisingera sp. M658]